MEFDSVVFEWRGPAPFFFAAIPEAECQDIREVSKIVSYGWGVIPCSVTVGKTTITTSLFPKQGSYLVPLKDALRAPEQLKVGDEVTISIEISV